MMAVIMFFVQCGFTPVYATGNIYYVDSLQGSDSNNGLSPEQAWKTADKVKNNTFSSGDTILFHRGQTWYDVSFTPNCDRLTYGAYGEGSAPVLNGSVAVDGWSVYEGNIYVCEAPQNESPYLIKYGDSLFRYSKPNNIEDLQSGYFCYLEGKIYINSPEEIQGTVYVQTAHNIFYINSKKNITIKDLCMTMSGGSCVNINGGKTMYTTVDNCEMSFAESQYGDGGGINCSSSRYGTFTNNNIHDVFGDGIMLWNSDGNSVIGNTVTRVMRGQNAGGDGIQCAGKSGNAAPDNIISNNFVSMEGSDSPKGCIQQENGDNVIISGNTCLYGYYGIEANSNYGLIENNYCAYQGIMENRVNWSSGLYMSEEEDITGMIWRNNIVYDSYPYGFSIRGNKINEDEADKQRTAFEIYNNTIYSTGTPFAAIGVDFDGKIRNNIFYNTIQNKTAVNIEKISEGKNVTSDYNIIGPQGNNFLKWDGNGYNDIWTFRSVTGNEINSRISAPQFVNVSYGQSQLPERNDFRLYSNSPGAYEGCEIKDNEGNVIYPQNCCIGAMQEVVDSSGPEITDPSKPPLQETPDYQKGLIVYEGFDYGATQLLAGQNGGEGWGGEWEETSASALNGKIGTDNLEYDGVYNTGYSAMFASSYKRQFQTPLFLDNETYYMSFIIKNSAGRGFTMSLDDSASGGKISLNWESKNGWRIKLRDKYQPYVKNEKDAFILMKITQSDNKTNVSAWINPDLSLGEDGLSSADMTDYSASKIMPDSMSISISTGALAFSVIDEIRIASNFKAVLTQTEINPSRICTGEITAWNGDIKIDEKIIFDELGDRLTIDIPLYNPEDDKSIYIGAAIKNNDYIKIFSSAKQNIASESETEVKMPIDVSNLSNDSYTVFVYIWDNNGMRAIRKPYTMYIVENN